MYIIVSTSRYTSYVPCHVYILVYTIMYMLYSSHFIICTVSSIPTGIYNNVHALLEENKARTLLYIPVGIHDTVHMIRSEE
jgi:hypothetical protein